MKTCTGCKIEKPFTEFVKDKKAKDGLNYRCRECVKAYGYINRDKRIANCKLWRQKNKEKQTEYFKIYRKKNKEYYNNYCQKNKEKIRETKKKWIEKNREKNNEYARKWYQNNNERLKTSAKTRRNSQPLYKLKESLRSRTTAAFKAKRWDKNSKTQTVLGEEWVVVKNYIEHKFKKGMSWDNHGDWHIDHIVPLSSANTEGELIKLCHYTNLQPLWAEENLKKGSKLIACKL